MALRDNEGFPVYEHTRECECLPNNLVISMPVFTPHGRPETELDGFYVLCDLCGNQTDIWPDQEIAAFKWNEFQYKRVPELSK